MTNKPVGHADDGSRKEKILRVRPRWIIRGLGAILTVVCMSGRLQIAAKIQGLLRISLPLKFAARAIAAIQRRWYGMPTPPSPMNMPGAYNVRREVIS
jgi:hypothetical protein